ncbi:MAG TPA: type II secretion system F family protein [Actinomycetota bacterium]|nr:type II secretion system F family protein [Actinomycetota bacterium]
METLFAGWFAVAVLGSGLAASVRADRRVGGRLGEQATLRPPAEGSPGAVARLAAGLERSRAFDRHLVAQRLALAGRPAGTREHAEARVRAALAAAACGVLLSLAAPEGLAALPILVVAGLRWPDVRLARAARARQDAIARAAPDLLDLVACCVAAGLSPPAGLDRAGARLGGPLGEEVRAALHLVAVGRPWRGALAETLGRTGVPSLRRLVSAFERTDRLGATLAPVLVSLAREARAERRAAAEERARAAPVKLLFPLVLLILPAFLLLTITPVVLATLRGLSGGP